MKQNQKQLWNNCFLDVTQFIISGPAQENLSQDRENVNSQANETPTPANMPIIIEVDSIELSPYFKQFFRNSHQATIQFLDFSLEIPNDKKNKKKSKYTADLIKEQQHEFSDSEQDQSDQQHVSESQCLSQSENSQCQGQQSPSHQCQQIQPSKLNINFFKRQLSLLKHQHSTNPAIKQFIMQYLTQQNMSAINIQTQEIQQLIPLVQWNLRQIGCISWLQRKRKVQKYMQKKKRRVWRKTISYDCRKRVADGRLRVKGKFVTKQQACIMLGLEDCPNYEIWEVPMTLLIQFKKK